MIWKYKLNESLFFPTFFWSCVFYCSNSNPDCTTTKVSFSMYLSLPVCEGGGLFCFVFPLENKITVFLSCFISCGLNIISVYFNYVIFWGLVCFTTTLRDTLKNFLICFIRHGFESVWHCLCIFSVQKVKDWLSVDFERKCNSRKWMETQKQPRIV